MTEVLNLRCSVCNWLTKEVSYDNKKNGYSFICENCKKPNFFAYIEDTETIKEVVEELAVEPISELIDDLDEELDEDWTAELEEIKGIGLETTADIKKIYSNKTELIEALNRNSVPLRNDVVIKLKTYFN